MKRLGVILLVLSGGAAAGAQVSGPMRLPNRTLSPGTIHVDVNLVLIDVSVTDKLGNPVAGLERKDFHLYEDQEEQEILTFSREDVPASVGILFDTSTSMKPRIAEARTAVQAFLQKSNPEDEFFLIDFNNHANLDSYFTPDISLIQRRAAPLIPDGRTALLDAIYLGLEQMRSAKNDRHVLIIISDGGDNHSRHHEGQVRDLLEESDSQVFALGIFNAPELVKTDEERKGPALLSQLAELTGGSLYTVQDSKDLTGFAERIGEELRTEYVLGFKPLHRGADYRHLKVRVESQPELKVHSRSGYYGPHDQ